MKRLSSRWAVGLMAAGSVLAAMPALAEKIGIVDFQRLLAESPQGKAMQESMRSEFAPRQRTLQAQEQALKAKQEKLQKDSATMSEDQRVKAEKDLRDGARDLQRAEGEFNDDVTARRNEELSRLQRALIEEVRTYAKAQSYDIVLSQETVAYQNPSYDITAAVLQALEARGGGKSTGAAPPKPSK